LHQADRIHNTGPLASPWCRRRVRERRRMRAGAWAAPGRLATPSSLSPVVFCLCGTVAATLHISKSEAGRPRDGILASAGGAVGEEARTPILERIKLKRGNHAVIARRWPAGSLRGLPFADVRTAVHVQHLPGDVMSLRKINDSLNVGTSKMTSNSTGAQVGSLAGRDLVPEQWAIQRTPVAPLAAIRA
jgi:hypothetical protein